ncbi:hypothetical protein Ciccas_013919, partial [Cichlidogyrus casuarinus]
LRCKNGFVQSIECVRVCPEGLSDTDPPTGNCLDEEQLQIFTAGIRSKRTTKYLIMTAIFILLCALVFGFLIFFVRRIRYSKALMKLNARFINQRSIIDNFVSFC